MAIWKIPWRVHIRTANGSAYCRTQEEGAVFSSNFEGATCDECSAERLKHLWLQEAAKEEDVDEELTGFCDQCETSQHPSRIKTKRVGGVSTTMCVTCWNRTFVSTDAQYGRRAASTSVSQQLYCPTCGVGWNPNATKVLFPRECFKCQHGGQAPDSDAIRASQTCFRDELKAEYLGTHTRHPLITNREVVAPPPGRNFSLINPGRDLVTDMKMVENMLYQKSGIGKLWDHDSPRPKKPKR